MKLSVLFRPRWLSTKNRWRLENRSVSSVGRDIVIFVLATLVIGLIYRGTRIGLNKIEEFAEFAYLPPSIPISILLLMLFAMLLISNSVSALGALFLARDLELILSAPVGRARFFFTKLTSIFVSTAWMPLCFVLPFLFAFGLHHSAPYWYYLAWPIILTPYFLLPTAIALMLATVFTALIPPSHTRVVLIVVVVLFLSFVYGAAQVITLGLQQGDDMGELLKILNMLALPEQFWLPSHWTALSVESWLAGDFTGSWVLIGLSYCLLACLLFLSFLSFTVIGELALSRASDRGEFLSRRSGLSRLTALFTDRLAPVYRAILLKDYRTFLRDMPQVIQLLLLAGIYLVYLYNLRIFRLVDRIPGEERVAWLAFIFVANAAMGAFIVTAAATRLVFPSVSLEGRGVWILYSGPVGMEGVLRHKFWSWYPAVALLAVAVFGSGGFALKLDLFQLLFTIMSALALSYGLVGLGLGIGSVFARFDWEHSAQLAASFGSFVFMLSSIALISVTMLPLGLALFAHEPGMIASHLSPSLWNGVVGLCGFFIVALNAYSRSFGLELGRKALEGQLTN